MTGQPEHHSEHDIVDRITRFVGGSRTEPFDLLARDAFAFQYRRIEPYRRLCEARGVQPDTLNDWRQVPAVPVSAFKTLELRTAPAIEVFRSSGTTGGDRSVHRHPYPDLYRHVIDCSFPQNCLMGFSESKPPMLSLVPSRQHLPDSSLGFMVDHVVRHMGASDSTYGLGPQGLDLGTVRAWCEARRKDGRAGLILSTSFALAHWLETLENLGERWPLPTDSVLFDTGGFKGKTRELPRDQLLQRLDSRLAIPPNRVVREYGMTELTSQFYTHNLQRKHSLQSEHSLQRKRSLQSSDLDVFYGPTWVRCHILDPETLEECPEGTVGMIAVLDLANVGSAIHLLTQDLGVATGDGFRLLGRATDAELRGCSLTAEELTDSN